MSQADRNSPSRALRNAWYAAAWSKELVASELLARTIIGDPIVLGRDDAGRAFGLFDRCAHRYAPLSRGRYVAGNRVRCGYHGLEFATDGQCVRNPHGGNIPSAARVRRYEVVERHLVIWIWMGDRNPDPMLIPDFGMLEGATPPNLAARDQLVLDVPAELVVDNLMDLSHTAYLHEGVLGNEETVGAMIDVRQDEDTVYVSRTALDVARPSFFDLMLPAHERVDKRATIRWNAPGCLLNDTSVFPRGADPESGTGIYGVHLVTPINERRTRYLFTAVRRNPLQVSPEQDALIEQQVSSLRRIAFETQDAVMIEAQQERMEQTRASLPGPTLLASDQGLVRKDRVLQRLYDWEKRTGE